MNHTAKGRRQWSVGDIPTAQSSSMSEWVRVLEPFIMQLTFSGAWCRGLSCPGLLYVEAEK